MEEDKIMAKYVAGTARALKQLAKEIRMYGFDDENKNLMQKIGANMLFRATAYSYQTNTKKSPTTNS